MALFGQQDNQYQRPNGGYGAMAGGNMAQYGGNMGLMDYAQQGQGMFPGFNQWAQPNNFFQPQQPVDLSPWESGGGGGGGPSYLQDRDLGGNRPGNWDQGGFTGPTDFGGMGKGQRKRFRQSFNKNAKKTGGPNFRKSQRQAFREGGGKRGGFKDWRKEQRLARKQGQNQGNKYDEIMNNPVFANAMMQSAGGMWPGMGQMMQNNPDVANIFMKRMGMPDNDYGGFGRGGFGGAGGTPGAGGPGGGPGGGSGF